MAKTYYKYAERQATDYVDWSKIGKDVSDMLTEEVKIREQKKAEIDKATQEFQTKLENAPQGQFQDANKFTTDYAAAMMQQQLLDTKLLKSGKMNPKDYILRRENYKNGTETLFSLQKLYQENYKKKMEGIQSGELQALTGANMASVEGFADFSKSKAVINPLTGVINIGIMKENPKTGILELSDDVVPANVIKGKIIADIPAWKADDVMNNTVKSLGKDIDYIYSAAKKTKAGTITKLLGLTALSGEASKYPEFQDSIDKANAAINTTIDSYFSNPYTITSVLTQNTGKYSQESFTYDKDEAAKDPSKILLKINKTSGLPIIDSEGAHYKDQVQEARDWVRTQLLGKLDSERSIDVTSTIPYGPPPLQWQYTAGQDEKNKDLAAGAWNQLYTATTAADKKAAAEMLLASPGAQERGLLGVDLSTPGKIKLTYKDVSRNVTYDMANTQFEDWALKGAEIHGQGDRRKAIIAGGGKKGGYGNLADYTGIKVERQGEPPAPPPLAEDIDVGNTIFSIKSKAAEKNLKSILPSYFKVKDIGGMTGNDVQVSVGEGENEKIYIFNANLKESEIPAAKADLEKFIKANRKGELD